MRTLYTFFLILLVSISSWAQSPTKPLTPSEHLLAINAQWEYNPISVSDPVSFRNDTERISYHIMQVVALLESREESDEAISARRHALLRTLKNYGKAGSFPINTLHSIRTPYFIDDFGTACAVGHLMIESGHEDLALRVKKEHNYDYIADIKTEGVSDWAAEYGFTLDELALIQPAYAPTNQMSNVGEGVNGNITCLAEMLDERLYMAGDFDLLDGVINCPNGLAYIEDETYHSVDNGPSGTINEMVRLNGYDLMVVGQLEHSGNSYPAAIYSGDNWEYISIPERPNAVGKTIQYHYNPEFRYVIGLDPQDGTGNNEVWRYLDGIIGTWDKIITTDGPILSATRQYYDYIGGDFNSYIDHFSGDIEVTSSGLVQFDLNSPSNLVIPYTSEFLPDAITTLLQVGEILYIGGTCDQNFPNTYLSRLQNNSFQALIYREEDWGQGDLGLYDISSYTNNQLLLAGDMYMGNIGLTGNNIGTYDLLGGYLTPLAALDFPARSLAEFNDEWYVGGDFTSNAGYPLSHFAKIGVPTGLIEEEQIAMTLSPNPASTYIDIRFDEAVSTVRSLQVYSLDGKQQSVVTRFADQTLHLDIQNLALGVYVYRIEMEEGVVSGRFVKE